MFISLIVFVIFKCSCTPQSLSDRCVRPKLVTWEQKPKIVQTVHHMYLQHFINDILLLVMNFTWWRSAHWSDAPFSESLSFVLKLLVLYYIICKIMCSIVISNLEYKLIIYIFLNKSCLLSNQECQRIFGVLCHSKSLSQSLVPYQ